MVYIPVVEIPRTLASTDRDTFMDNGKAMTSRDRLLYRHNYGLVSKIDESGMKFSLDAKAEARLFADSARLNATVFEDPTSTELFIDGGGEHTSIVPPEAVVGFIHAALEEIGRRPHEVNVSAIRHNLTGTQLAALGEVGFAGFNVIPPEDAAQIPIQVGHIAAAHA